MTLAWNVIDASRKNEQVSCYMLNQFKREIEMRNIKIDNEQIVKEFASQALEAYESKSSDELNKSLAVDIFRPHEFDSCNLNDKSLKILSDFILSEKFDWRNKSDILAKGLRKKFMKAGSCQIEGSRGDHPLKLDALLLIENRRVAIEVEFSNNLDNGYNTLRLAIRKELADCGVMLVPWSSKAKYLADEGKALSKLDQEFDGSSNMHEGPIYRFAVVRLLDIYKLGPSLLYGN